MSDDEELLINTRQRRANAGNRLKHLLELEEQQQLELQQSFATEDDENVNLLFQEDEEDVEYSEEVSSEELEEDDQSGDEDGDQLSGLDDLEDLDDLNLPPSGKKRRREDEEVNDDDVFTDSDDDSGESDAEEGEKELQLNERLKKRAKLKKAKLTVIPVIRKASATKESRKKTYMVDADSLLAETRRASSRRSVVENKMATVQKLKELEERRKLNKPKPKVERHEMTQEERLQEALETEKKNILSLNKFKEQELSKKERQRLLQLSRRIKLINVVRLVSYGRLLTPVEEILEEKRLQEWRESRREKRGRRKRVLVDEKKEVKKTVEVNLTPVLETSITPKSGSHEPEIKTEAMEIKEEALGENNGELSLDIDGNGSGNNGETKLETLETNGTSKEETGTSVKVNEVHNETNEDGITPNESVLNSPVPEDSKLEVPESVESREETSEPVESEENSLQLGNSDDAANEEKEDKHEVEGSDKMDRDEVQKTDTKSDSKQNDTSDVEMREPETEEQSSENQTEVKEEPTTGDHPKVKEEGNEQTDVKKVTFATEEDEEKENDTKDTNEISKDGAETPDDVEQELEEEPEEEPEEDPIEGPPQLVATNLVSFEDFKKPLTTATVKEILLGPQSLYSLHRRSTELEPVLRIKANSEDENLEKNLFKSFRELKKQEFKDFFNLPKFGDDLSVLNMEDEEEEEEVVHEVKITTKAPVGIYLPNGQKKKCLITGKEAQYFDPKNGLPYSSVDAYKVLQQVQNGEFAWCQFSSSGGVYLNDRKLKPASGCPDWF